MVALAKKPERTYQYLPIQQGFPAYVAIYDKGEHAPVGWAVIVGTEDPGCLLLDMWVDPAKRRMGVGTDIIKILQSRYAHIITGFSTPEGRELCLSCGFELKRGIHKKDLPKLQWVAPMDGKR